MMKKIHNSRNESDDNPNNNDNKKEVVKGGGSNQANINDKNGNRYNNQNDGEFINRQIYYDITKDD